MTQPKSTTDRQLVWEIVNQGARGRDLSGADLHEADLHQADLSGASLKGASLCWTDLKGTNLKGADLAGVDLTGANLYRANLEGADLTGTNLTGANLSGAILNGARVDETTQIDDKWRLVWEIVNQGAEGRDLTGADLRGADLSWANLKGADLSRADLTGANLKGANLKEVSLGGANLREANLKGANLDGAQIDDTTQLDDNWHPVLEGIQQEEQPQTPSKTDLSATGLKEADPAPIPVNQSEAAIDTLWQRLKLDDAALSPVDRRWPVSGLLMLLFVGIILLIAGLGYIFWFKPAWEQPSPPVIVALEQSPTPDPTSTPVPPTSSPATVLPVAMPSAGDAVADEFSVRSIPDDGSIIVTPAAEAVGWVSSLDEQSHFNDPNIHVGFFKGHVYHGAIQFDLSAIPPHSIITNAALELTGLGDQYLSSGGLWQVRLLDPAIDRVWPALTYNMLHNVPVTINIMPALTAAGLARNRANVFSFGPEQLAVLQQRLAKGVVSFRLDGPSSGDENFFTWDSGYRAGEGVETKPVLRLAVVSREYVIITSTPMPENVFTAVAMMPPTPENLAATETPTPLPPHWVTPIVVTPQPTPANPATATFEAEMAAAEAIINGTATPTPLNVWTATPTPSDYVIVTSTPTPENIVTAGAIAATATQVARTTGTYTPVPENWVTPIVVTPVPTPANSATVEFQAAVATAEAIVNGTAAPTPFNVWTTTPTPTPTPTETPAAYVVVTSIPPPENIVTAGAMAATATQIARTIGTYTPVPENWVTPIIVTPMPAPANSATVEFQAAVVTAEAILHGTDRVIWTATPTPAFIAVEGEIATPWAPYTPTPTPLAIPPVLVGKIAFLSNRSGGEELLAEPLVYLIDADGSNLMVLTDRNFYDLAVARDRYSVDQRFRAFVKDALRFDGQWVPAVYFYDYLYNAEDQITRLGAGLAWDPVWSPTGEQIAFVSNDTKDDEIWVVNRDGSNLLRLTGTNETFNARQIGKDTFIPEINGHPSWSPDGSQIVFWSNRTGNRQIWVMDADGSNLHSLSTTNYDDWDPVWIKYTDPARNPVPVLGPVQSESPPETPEGDGGEESGPDSEP